MNEDSPTEGEFHLFPKTPLSIPRPESERRIPIRRVDWLRMKRNIDEAEKPTPRLIELSSVFFGTAATSGVYILSSFIASEAIWTKIFIIFCIVFFTSLICGLVFFFLDRKLHKFKKTELRNIVEEMDEIDSQFDINAD